MMFHNFQIVTLPSVFTTALPTLLIVVALVAFFAALGRSAVPRAERLPWSRWSAKDLIGNVMLGVRRFSQLNERNPMTPHKRTPLHTGEKDPR